MANSHTGALAGSGETWATVFRQARIVQVEDIQDLINICTSLNDLPLPRGKGVSIITYSGGFSVVQSDMCVKAGLDVPQFSTTAINKLREFVPAFGTMVCNPLDAWQMFYRFEEKDSSILDTFKIIADEKDIHSLILQFDQARFMANRWGDKFEERFESVAKKVIAGCSYVRDVKGKPIIVSIGLDPFAQNGEEKAFVMNFKKRCEKEGIPVLPSLYDTVNTVAYLYKYVNIRVRDILPPGKS